MRIHVLSAAEEMAYFAAAKRWPNLHDLGKIMLNQGFRPEEVMGLRKQAVNLESGHILIVDGKSDAGRRRLRLTPETRSILASRISSVARVSLSAN